ncbi:MAG: hypothetical protein WAU68_12325 [Vitreimonas sp.]
MSTMGQLAPSPISRLSEFGQHRTFALTHLQRRDFAEGGHCLVGMIMSPTMRNLVVDMLYKELFAAPFPRLGASLGFFAAYDGDIAGFASRAAEGEIIDASLLPEPDAEAVAFASKVRSSVTRTTDEAEFLQYFDLLERLRSAISAASD